MNSTRTLLVSMAAAGLLVGAAATAGLLNAGAASAVGASPSATSPSPTPKATPGVPGPNGRQGYGRGGFRGPGGFGGPGGLGGVRGLGQGPVLHGEFVTGGQNGSTRTVVLQTGTVTAKNGSTITVTSTDNYKVDWTLNDSTRVRTGWSQGAVKDIAVGDTVQVEGTKSGGTTTAALVAERPKGTPAAPGSSGSSSSPSPSGA